MIADNIKALLPADWPLTVGDLPSPNVEAVCIIEFDGYYNTQYFGRGPGTLIGQPLVKIVGRTASYQTGEFWMEEAKRRLNRYIGEDDDEILSITMVGTPSYLGRNSQKFHEFQVTFQVKVKE